MKRILFIASHYCSGSDSLYKSLNKHSKIQGFRGNIIYDNVPSLISLTDRDHKLNDASAIYMDELLTNNSIASKSIYSNCQYIFVIRDPRDALNEIIVIKGYKPRQAVNYYLFRLRRLYSIALKRPDSILLTFADLEAGKGSDLIMDYFHLKEPIMIDKPVSMGLDNKIPIELLNDATAGFEYWLYNLKQIGLTTPSS